MCDVQIKGEKHMRLSELLQYREIIIQCHDNPDADTIASAYGLYLYFKFFDKNVRIIYSGRSKISKSNLKMLIDELHIPIEHVTSLYIEPELLITVDCQYGEGNVTHFHAQKIAVIDHHKDCEGMRDFAEIFTEYGSCTALVYRMLVDENYPIHEDSGLMTALYFGLYMDTNAFSEARAPYDYDLLESIQPKEQLFQQLKNTNFTMNEIEIAANALIRCEFNKEDKLAIIKANPCDPNLLGFISDMVLQVEGVNTAVAFFLQAMREYFQSYDIIENGTALDRNEMELYERRPTRFGVIPLISLGEEGKKLLMVTLHQSLEVTVSKDNYLLVNHSGEAFEITRDRLEERYRILEKVYDCSSDYPITFHDIENNTMIQLMDDLQCCISKHKKYVRAKELTKAVKVYYNFESKIYVMGDAGDYIAYKNEDEEKNLFIIKHEDLLSLYEHRESVESEY